MIKLLRKFAEAGGPAGFRHFANAHFPGLYSVVLAADGDCLARAFIARPGELHEDLQSPTGTFLWHSHGYDFTETTIAGRVVNWVIAVGSHGIYNEYEIEAGIATGRRPTLKHVGKRAFDLVRTESRCAGESFSMTHEEIHRVLFKPCSRSGWFCCLVEERNKVSAPSTVFCEKELTEVPNADVLYQPIDDLAARSLVNKLLHEIS